MFEAGCHDQRERERERERERDRERSRDFGVELRDMFECQVGFHWYQAVLLLLDFNDGSLVDHVKSSCVIALSIIYPYRVVGEVTRLGLGEIIDSE